jgi:hypothetical protein
MIGAELPVQGADAAESQEDAYYRLDLPLRPVWSGVAYMTRRATRELRVAQSSFGQEHLSVIDAFIAGRELEAGYSAILGQIGAYLGHSPTAVLLEARKGSELVPSMLWIWCPRTMLSTCLIFDPRHAVCPARAICCSMKWLNKPRPRGNEQ